MVVLVVCLVVVLVAVVLVVRFAVVLIACLVVVLVVRLACIRKNRLPRPGLGIGSWSQCRWNSLTQHRIIHRLMMILRLVQVLCLVDCVDNPVVMTVLVVVVKLTLLPLVVLCQTKKMLPIAPAVVPVGFAGTMWLRFAVMSYGLLLLHCREWPVVYLLQL